MKTNEFRKLIKKFGKFFDEKKEGKDDLKNQMIERLLGKKVDEMKIKPENYVGYLNKGKFLMVIPKNLLIKGLIEENFDVEPTEEIKSFISQEAYLPDGKEATGYFSPELLRLILNLFEDGNVGISLKNDFPIKLENGDFIFILGPRSKPTDKNGDQD